MTLESAYQAELIKKLKRMFPGCIVQKNDPNYQQGFPDLTILYNNLWATLEVKASANSPEQPNQRYFVERMSEMTFSAFIYPENEEEVLHALQQAFKPVRIPRVPKR